MSSISYETSKTSYLILPPKFTHSTEDEEVEPQEAGESSVSFTRKPGEGKEGGSELGGHSKAEFGLDVISSCR